MPASQTGTELNKLRPGTAIWWVEGPNKSPREGVIDEVGFSMYRVEKPDGTFIWIFKGEVQGTA